MSHKVLKSSTVQEAEKSSVILPDHLPKESGERTTERGQWHHALFHQFIFKGDAKRTLQRNCQELQAPCLLFALSTTVTVIGHTPPAGQLHPPNYFSTVKNDVDIEYIVVTFRKSSALQVLERFECTARAGSWRGACMLFNPDASCFAKYYLPRAYPITKACITGCMNKYETYAEASQIVRRCQHIARIMNHGSHTRSWNMAYTEVGTTKICGFQTEIWSVCATSSQQRAGTRRLQQVAGKVCVAGSLKGAAQPKRAGILGGPRARWGGHGQGDGQWEVWPRLGWAGTGGVDERHFPGEVRVGGVRCEVHVGAGLSTIRAQDELSKAVSDVQAADRREVTILVTEAQDLAAMEARSVHLDTAGGEVHARAIWSEGRARGESARLGMPQSMMLIAQGHASGTESLFDTEQHPMRLGMHGPLLGEEGYGDLGDVRVQSQTTSGHPKHEMSPVNSPIASLVYQGEEREGVEYNIIYPHESVALETCNTLWGSSSATVNFGPFVH
ncbi:hypothetical protein B0H10DRAFT_1946968 [Mycena sp. CBHHK59/15]|nr:hypothetical protein B0H10DRAFT_1946968 [Mycena sp. CBHHK59/15]